MKSEEPASSLIRLTWLVLGVDPLKSAGPAQLIRHLGARTGYKHAFLMLEPPRVRKTSPSYALSLVNGIFWQVPPAAGMAQNITRIT